MKWVERFWAWLKVPWLTHYMFACAWCGKTSRFRREDVRFRGDALVPMTPEGQPLRCLYCKGYLR